MARKIDFDPEDEEFFGKVGSFGVPKFDNEMHGGVPRYFHDVLTDNTGSGSELLRAQFTSPAEEFGQYPVHFYQRRSTRDYPNFPEVRLAV